MVMLLDQALLEQEQKELLCKLVEAQQSRPRDQRQKFMLFHGVGSPLAELSHPGLPEGEADVYEGDLEALCMAGLLSVTYGSRGTPNYDVSPHGYQYYREFMESRGSLVEHAEAEVMRYVKAGDFGSSHPVAAKKVIAAETHLLSAQALDRVTDVGHLCREALQSYATDLVNRVQPSDAPTEEVKTKARLRAVLRELSDHLGPTRTRLLEAALEYWSAVNDYVQRQEHGSKNPDRPLTVDDAKRCVLHTAMVMFEVEAALTESDE